MGPAWIRPGDDCLLVDIRLTPKAARDAIDGVNSGTDGRAYLAARVRAVPEAGKANKALEVLIAKSLKLPKSAVSVAGGQTSRLKTVRIACEPAGQRALIGRLAAYA